MQIEENKKKLKKLAQHNFAEMVQRRREEIKQLEGIQKRYETSKKSHDSHVEAIKKELSEVDDAIKGLRRGLQLDSFEERCKYH